jgi:hypothetical protein
MPTHVSKCKDGKRGKKEKEHGKKMNYNTIKICTPTTE